MRARQMLFFWNEKERPKNMGRGRQASTGIMRPGWHAELRELVKVRKQQLPTKNWHSLLN